MDKTLPMDNPEPEEGGAEDFATRRIDPDELFAAAGQEVPPESVAATEMITQAEDPAATKVVSGIPESAPPAPQATEPPPPPVTPVAPGAPLPPAPPKKDNRTPTVAIIGVAVVLLACICACTIIAVTALVMMQNY